MEKEVKIVQEEIENLLKKIGVESTVEVEKGEESFLAVLDAHDDNALLIGKHGNTLASFELIVTLIVSNKLGEFKRVTIEVGSYRSEREKYLMELADKLKEEVISSGYEKPIRGLKPWERRFVHVYLQEDNDVITESNGEDRERTLVIKRK
jgi:spoIIIJ-associated protein